MMDAIRVMILCVAAAFVCAMLRQHRPEIALMLSLATGISVLLMAGDSIRLITGSLQRLVNLKMLQSEYSSMVLKAAGISIISELGGQICCDAGENALAGRIKLACRIAMLTIALPGLNEIIDLVANIAV